MDDNSNHYRDVRPLADRSQAVKAMEWFRQYVQERSHAELAGFRREALKGLVRYTPEAADLEGIVMFASMAKSEAEAVITDQIDYFEAMQRDFEWKVYDFDEPSDLAIRLEHRGFRRGVKEAFMLYDLTNHSGVQRSEGLRLDRITDTKGIRDIVTLQETVWGEPFPWLEAALLESLDRTVIYCAYVEAVPVACGWIEFPLQSSFAEIHGGAVLPALRGQGIYREIFNRRAADAQRRGYRYIAVDAAPMSRPILLKQGFKRVCDTVPMRWTCRARP